MPRRSSSPLTALVAFRTEPAIADRLDALAVKFSTKLHEANRSDVARVAVELGLERLETEGIDAAKVET